VTSLSTQFIAAEILRLGDALRYPDLPGCGINKMSAGDAQRVRDLHREYAAELARRCGGDRPPRSLAL